MASDDASVSPGQRSKKRDMMIAKKVEGAIALGGFLVLLALLAAACGTTATPVPTPIPKPEPTIPPHFTTYTNEQKLFSISYPQDWEPALSLLAELEETTKELLKSVESDLRLEKASMVFVAGIPTEEGFHPNVNIFVESLDVSSLVDAVEMSIKGIKTIVSDYKSRLQRKSP